MNMRSVSLRLYAAVALVALASSAAARSSGWIAAVGFALGGTTVLTLVARRLYLRPLSGLRGTLGPHAPTSAADLAEALASEHRAAMEKVSSLRHALDRAETALAHATDGVVLMDADGRVVHANPAARLLISERTLDVARRLGHADLEDLVRRAVGSGEPLADEVSLHAPGPRPARARALPLGDGGCVLLLSDLSEAHRLDRVRRDFVANVSHELKTPVAGVRALADVASTALGDGDHETARTFVVRLQAEAERLAQLVTDLLDLSRVEAGGAVTWEPVELRSLLDAAAERAHELAASKGVSIDVAGEPAKVEGDASQLAMAVRNLTDNAVRYSDVGTVRLSLERRSGWIAIVVSDEGIGIPSSDLERIFERFYRVDRARSRATGGTGLGLAIVRHVVQNHGGRVEVTSELGAGSTFTILLPVGASLRRGNAA